MAKNIALVASTLFVLCLASTVQSHDLELKGRVYCDPCNVYFWTALSKSAPGARVELTCKNQDTGAETLKVEAVARDDSSYKIPIKTDHESDICEVRVLSNPDSECNVISDKIDNVKVSLTKNTGIDSTTRFANPIGFVRKAPTASCTEELKKMGYEWVGDDEPMSN